MISTEEKIKEEAVLEAVRERQPADNWDNLSDYMKIKQRKLVSQFHSSGNRLSNIFNGM